MAEETTGIGETLLTRRAFLTRMSLATVVAGAACLLSGARLGREDSPIAPRPRRQIVFFHMDRLHVDATGTAAPYQPPLGARSGAPVEHLSEEEFRRHFVYV